MPGKKVTAQTITGQQGINLIERRVLEMGCLWYPTGGYEAGIDGHIELLDPTTGEALNLTIRVQSRATKGQFEAETPKGFDYTCTEKDLSYWLSGNAAVILVRSRPDTDEAYWVSLKDYFSDPATRKSRKIHFDKSRNLFDKNARCSLAEVGSPIHHGVYFAPPPLEETLYSNILPVTRFADRLYLGQTTYGSPRDVLEHLARSGATCGPEWYLKKKRAVLSFHDLAEAHWNAIVDPGTVESFGTEEWSKSSDIDRVRDFVALLNRCLQAKLLASDVAYYPPKDYYYFTATKDLSPREIRYRSLAQNAQRTVFLGYPNKNKPGEIGFYRHSALQAHFRRYGRMVPRAFAHVPLHRQWAHAASVVCLEAQGHQGLGEEPDRPRSGGDVDRHARRSRPSAVFPSALHLRRLRTARHLHGRCGHPGRAMAPQRRG